MKHKINQAIAFLEENKVNQAIALLKELMEPEGPEGPEGPTSEFENLKSKLHSDEWPKAVNSNLICDVTSDVDKKDRAAGIVELMIEESVKDRRFLDYGCGEGHCVPFAKDSGATTSTGYDIHHHDSWDKIDFTTDYDKVKSNGPYDIILLFDVIDHLEQDDPVSLLIKTKEMLSETGKIYMRCHPYTSRHACHHYHELNKAYIHLIFTPEELKQLMPTTSKYILNNIGDYRPIRYYNDCIEKAGLEVVNRRDIVEKIEPFFFDTPTIVNRIIQNTASKELPKFQMGLQFLDYVITKNN